MDLLKREMERKKKVMEQAKAAAAAVIVPGEEDNDKNDKIDDHHHGRKKRTFLRASDLRKLQEEEEEKLRKRRRNHEMEKDRTPTTNKNNNSNNSQPPDATLNEDTTVLLPNDEPNVKAASSKEQVKKSNKKVLNDNKDNQSSLNKAHKWTPVEVTKRLREMGLPIRLFGERTVRISKADDHGNDQANESSNEYDDSQRVERLQQAMAVRNDALSGLSELDEFRLSSGHGIRNTFLEKDEDKEANAISMAAVAAAAATSVTPAKSSKSTDNKSSKAKSQQQQLQDSDGGVNKQEDKEEQDALDPHKRIYKYFKGLLKDWEHELAQRLESVARSVAGKNDTKTLKQCKDYIRPLFKLCKNRQLEPGLMSHIIKIVDFCQQGEFVRAHDAYMDVAIGRAAWPIGVTMVGIHARSGRAKIESSNVAHVMNSELQRKYLTSVKRLMSYAQKMREDVDPSKKVSS